MDKRLYVDERREDITFVVVNLSCLVMQDSEETCHLQFYVMVSKDVLAFTVWKGGKDRRNNETQQIIHM